MKTAIPIVEQPNRIQLLHGLALECIEELNEHADKIFSVASGGLAYAMQGQHSSTEAILFQVIKDMTESTDLSGTLRERINELAALAGSKLATETPMIDHTTEHG